MKLTPREQATVELLQTRDEGHAFNTTEGNTIHSWKTIYIAGLDLNPGVCSSLKKKGIYRPENDPESKKCFAYLRQDFCKPDASGFSRSKAFMDKAIKHGWLNASKKTYGDNLLDFLLKAHRHGWKIARSNDHECYLVRCKLGTNTPIIKLEFLGRKIVIL